jgi:CheY-like chemotaxis protein
MKTINQSPITILVIDADAESLARVTAVLDADGYTAVAAGCAQSALAAARQATPDLILCDINVAGHSGLVLCDELRRQTGLGDVPLMFLSATQTPDIIRRSHLVGGTYYLRKPFDAKVLLQLVEKAVRVPHLTGA